MVRLAGRIHKDWWAPTVRVAPRSQSKRNVGSKIVRERLFDNSVLGPWELLSERASNCSGFQTQCWWHHGCDEYDDDLFRRWQFQKVCLAISEIISYRLGTNAVCSRITSITLYR